MGFFSGRVTFLRYRVEGTAPRVFGPEHLDQLAERQIGKQRLANKDGSDVGWIAGDDILDTEFDQEKNVIAEMLHCAMRIDTQRLPGDLLRAYTRIDLQALAADNPSGRPSARQRREARESARDRLELEAQDGRFTRRKAVPVLWDRQTQTLLIATGSVAAAETVQKLFHETFGLALVRLDAGRVAADHKAARRTADLRPASFVPGGEDEVAWATDPASPDFLGNEFLLWLWFWLEVESDTLPLADGSDVTAMLARTLHLECPRSQSGSETIRSEAPARLPEARRAVQGGKLPRKAGLTLVRHEQTYELTLQAETLAVSGAKLPPIEESDERAKLEERAGQLRHLIETVDLMYDAFLERRLAVGWPKELERVQRWLRRAARESLSATA